MRVRITCEHEASSRAPEGTYVLKDFVIAGQTVTKRIRPVGLELEGADVWKLIGVGIADPVDDEARAKFTPAQIALAKATGHPELMRRNAEAQRELLMQRVEQEGNPEAVAEVDVFDEVTDEEGGTENAAAESSGGAN